MWSHKFPARIAILIVLILFLLGVIVASPPLPFPENPTQSFLYFSEITSDETIFEVKPTILPELHKSNPTLEKDLTSYVALDPGIFNNPPEDIRFSINSMDVTKYYSSSLSCDATSIGVQQNLCFFRVPNSLIASTTIQISSSQDLFRLNSDDQTWIGIVFVLATDTPEVQ